MARYSYLADIEEGPWREKQVGNLTVRGTNWVALVVGHLMLRDVVMEEFDNATTTNREEPSAFRRALCWAEDCIRHEGEN